MIGKTQAYKSSGRGRVLPLGEWSNSPFERATLRWRCRSTSKVDNSSMPTAQLGQIRRKETPLSQELNQKAGVPVSNHHGRNWRLSEQQQQIKWDCRPLHPSSCNRYTSGEFRPDPVPLIPAQRPCRYRFRYNRNSPSRPAIHGDIEQIIQPGKQADFAELGNPGQKGQTDRRHRNP